MPKFFSSSLWKYYKPLLVSLPLNTWFVASLLTSILCILGICKCLEAKSPTEDYLSALPLFQTLNSWSSWLVVLTSSFSVSSPIRRCRVQATAFCLCYPGIGKCLKGTNGRECRTQFNKCFFSLQDLGFSCSGCLGFSAVPSNIFYILSAFMFYQLR